MAGGIEIYYLNRDPDHPALVSIVKPAVADCICRSARTVGRENTFRGRRYAIIMAGLNCGTPCAAIWPVLRDSTSFFCACIDFATEEGMRSYARPVGTDPVIVSGESGAVTYGLLLEILQSEPYRKKFRIGPDSVILLISTEGDTDPEGYAKVVGA